MADRPTEIPEWGTDPGADIVEPPEGKKEIGWQQGEKPPAGYFNWLFALLTRWVAWFADKIKGREGFGIDVPEGIATTHIDVDRGTGATGPGLVAEGYGATAPGGRFGGHAPLHAVAESGSAPAVHAEVGPGSSGPAITARIARPDPVRGALSIPAIGLFGHPSSPGRGDIYYNGNQGALLWYDGAEWVHFAWESNRTRRHILGGPGEPSLHPDWSAYDDVSFYWDGRRVWLSGRVSRGVGGSSEVIFTLPEAFRPATEVWLPTAMLAADSEAVAIVIQPDGDVVLDAVSGTVSMLLLDGLSFGLGGS